MISKKNKRITQTLRISNDQNKEKLRIKWVCVLLIKESTKQPNNGIEIIVNNISKEGKYFENNKCETKQKYRIKIEN